MSFFNVKLLLCFLCLALTGAMSPIDVCERRPIHTTASQTDGNNGFHVKVVGLTDKDQYIPGEEYKVIINGSEPTQLLLGVMLVAIPNDTKVEDKSLGTFKLYDNEDVLQVARQCNHTVIVHRFLLPKKGVFVVWKAPPRGAGCVQFRATVIEEAHLWYKDHGDLTKVICEQPTIEKTQKDEMVNDKQDKSCCACGYATYKMVFQGLWSRQTHPKDFPTQTPLLHWSNIVGASHSNSYRIWDYGEYASRAVKYVCEFGSSNILETEMKSHSDKIRTVVKTPQMWGNVLNTRQALFTVTKDFNYVSLITMIGPSPDWCLGISAVNLCQENCTWADKLEIDLFPWDAGTDSGPSYMSHNMVTKPQEKIHKITNHYPNGPSSPFYGPNPIKPMAHLTITKEKEKCKGNSNVDDGEHESPSTEELVNMMKKKVQMKKKLQMEKCEMSTWSEWTKCSVSCGMGSQQRRRMLNHAHVTPAMCKSPLVETKKCFELADTCETGLDKKFDPVLENKKKLMHLRPGKVLPGDFIFQHQDTLDTQSKCAVTPWSPWSPCSHTCGRGMRERWRIFTSKEGNPEMCNLRRSEKDLCYGRIPDCRKADMMKNWTVICTSPPDDGPCRAKFQRFYYDTRMRKCLPFNYGGCRGNENRFDTESECLAACADQMRKLHLLRNSEELTKKYKEMRRLKKEMRRKMKKARRHRHVSPRINCMVTPWSDWSACSVTCGDGFKMKNRMIKVEPKNGGRKCPKKLAKKKSCRIAKCPVDCKMSEWQEWTECQATCGMKVMKVRRRKRMVKPRRGGKACPPKIERRLCNVPLCETVENVDPSINMIKEMPPTEVA